MGKVIRNNLAVLTLLAALVGGMVSSLFRFRISHPTAPMSAEELLREIETGNGMPVIAASTAITARFSNPSIDSGGSIPLLAKDKATLFVPDKYALAAMVCETTDEQFHRV